MNSFDWSELWIFTTRRNYEFFIRIAWKLWIFVCIEWMVWIFNGKRGDSIEQHGLLPETVAFQLETADLLLGTFDFYLKTVRLSRKTFQFSLWTGDFSLKGPLFLSGHCKYWMKAMSFAWEVIIAESWSKLQKGNGWSLYEFLDFWWKIEILRWKDVDFWWKPRESIEITEISTKII